MFLLIAFVVMLWTVPAIPFTVSIVGTVLSGVQMIIWSIKFALKMIDAIDD